MVDDRLRTPAHSPTGGILVCGTRNDATVRYSLGGAVSPMAVSTYTYETLPAAERGAVPDELTLARALAAEAAP